MTKTSKKESIVVLHDIRSVQNVGSIFRTADALGIDKIYLSGFTPLPQDRFGRWRKDFSKTALGAEKTLSWEYIKNVSALLKKLKKEGFKIVAIEQDPTSCDYKKVKVTEKTLFMVGNEVEGLSKKILKEADIIAEIPMKGKKESLNVAVSFGIALYRILNI